jgi:hypothetical protein
LGARRADGHRRGTRDRASLGKENVERGVSRSPGCAAIMLFMCAYYRLMD